MYKDNFKRKALVIFSIVFLALVIVFVVYFIFSWCSLGSVDISIEEIKSSSYSTLDTTSRLRFISDKYVVFEVKNERFIFDFETLKYIDGVIILNNDDKQFYFAALSNNRLYNNEFNVMLYSY